jgi:sterol desaturase/sphingolipid hydroxylase (fatty acid hydroxylase superfamily)
MTDFLHFIEAMPDWQRLAWLLVCLAFCWVLESLIPLFRWDNKKLKHDAFNLGLFVMNGVITLPVSIALGMAIIWSESNQVGLLYQLELPLWMELLLAIVFLDLIAQYTVHYLLHHVNWMWRLHLVHHADTHVDASSGTRHHPGDFAFRLVASGVAIIAFGIPAVYYVIYRILTPFFGYFTHANIKLPKQLDRVLSLVLVTPDMHKFHHHYQAPWTDSNFGNIFSFWDRLFGTLVYEDTADIQYGLDVMDNSRDLDLMYQLKAPIDSSIDSSHRPGLTN